MAVNPVPDRANDPRRTAHYREHLDLALQGKLGALPVNSTWARLASDEDIKAGNYSGSPLSGRTIAPTTEAIALRRINAIVQKKNTLGK